ncbi:MAG: 4Fe-4S dicluster domain-containing protein [Tepidisphaeraceae bacterium]
MSSCPTGALVPTPLVQIKMGTAVWRQHQCTRTTLEDDCRRCVDVCPMGAAAIDLVEDYIEIKPLGCIGCGLCQQDCPTSPRAIAVIPKSARER